MKVFGRTGGHYLFWTGAVYFAVGTYCIFVDPICPVWLAQVAWIAIMCLPFAIPPFGRWLNMSIDWDIKMFDFFRRETAKEYMDEASNVYNLPKPKAVPPMSKVEPPKEKEPEGKIFYRLGLTDNNRVAFSMNHMEITMNYDGCQQMIDQIAFFQSQLYDDGNNGGGGGGGEPLPIPGKEQKAA